MKVFELIDVLMEQDGEADIRIVSDATGETLGYPSDVDEDGDVLIFVDTAPDA